MSTIQLPGLATGIDTAKMVQQLMQVEQRRLILMQNSISKYGEKRTAITELQSKLNTFKSALKNLSDSSQLRAYKVSTGDSDIITAEANSNAAEGNHSVQIKQLATAERWVHGGYKYATSYVGAGNFIFSYNNQELIVHTTETTTLQDLVNLINNDSDNPGVTASILKYDDGSGKAYHLVLSGRQSGSDYQITVNSSNTEVHTADSMLTVGGSNAEKTAALKDLSTFSGQIESGDTPDQIHITGTQHDGTAVDYSFDVTQYTTVEDLLGEMEAAFGDTIKVTYKDGQIKVTDTTSGTSLMTVAIEFVPGDNSTALLTLPAFARTSEGGTIPTSVASLVPATFTETQSAQDSLIRVDNYPPVADEWISRSANTIDDVISGVTLRLHATTQSEVEGQYDSVDVNLTRDTEQLKEKLNKMIEAYNTVIMYLDEKTSYDQDAKKSGILTSDYSLTSIRSLIRTPLLTMASGFGSSDSFTAAKDIGLTIGADGMLELDAGKFDESIVEDYLGVLSLIGAVKTGSSSGTDAAYIKFYAASKYTQAGTFNVRVTVDGSGVITSALIKKSSEQWSQARAATINGNTISGSSALDSQMRPLYPEYDLQLTVDTGQTGRTMEATISARQGFAGALYETADQALRTGTGRVPIAQKSINDQIARIEKRIENEEKRLEGVQTRLTARFARMEKMLAMIQQQMSGLSLL